MYHENFQNAEESLDLVSAIVRTLFEIHNDEIIVVMEKYKKLHR